MTQEDKQLLLKDLCMRIPYRTFVCLNPDAILEQPEVDLEKEIDRKVIECTNGYDFDWDKFARHFYELGKNAK